MQASHLKSFSEKYGKNRFVVMNSGFQVIDSGDNHEELVETYKTKVMNCQSDFFILEVKTKITTSKSAVVTDL